MKHLIIAVLVSAAIVQAVSAANLYQNTKYVTINPPTRIGKFFAVDAGVPTATNSAPVVSNTTGVAVNAYPGTAALVLHVNCGDSGTGVIAWQGYSTTNIGTAGTYTNGTFVASANQDVNSIAWTNIVTNAVLPFVPNRELGWFRSVFTATGVTNGSVGAVLVTTPQ